MNRKIIITIMTHLKDNAGIIIPLTTIEITRKTTKIDKNNDHNDKKWD